MIKKLLNGLMAIIMFFMSKVMPACDVITMKMSESMDRRISLYDRIMIRIHILTCNLCERYLRQLRAMHDMIHQYSIELEKEENLPDVALNDESRERMKKTLEEHIH